ncbi:hypothetical protein FJZ21_01000 [Candidatus Pacearchaeota archaeon]|nr:hypothetical protein [Candidatus Pacearchaeota archaeon]
MSKELTKSLVILTIVATLLLTVFALTQDEFIISEDSGSEESEKKSESNKISESKYSQVYSAEDKSYSKKMKKKELKILIQ